MPPLVTYRRESEPLYSTKPAASAPRPPSTRPLIAVAAAAPVEDDVDAPALADGLPPFSPLNPCNVVHDAVNVELEFEHTAPTVSFEPLTQFTAAHYTTSVHKPLRFNPLYVIRIPDTRSHPANYQPPATPHSYPPTRSARPDTPSRNYSPPSYSPTVPAPGTHTVLASSLCRENSIGRLDGRFG